MKTIVFDAHCDTPVELWRKGEHLRNSSGQVSLRRAEKLDGWVQFFAFLRRVRKDQFFLHRML